MNRILLTSRPKYDDGTEYLAYYASLIIKKAQSLGIKTKDFEGRSVTPENITKFIQKKNPRLVFINGHGNETTLEGDKGKVLFSINKNLGLLKNRIIYARACNAGISLGKEVVKQSSGCFIGYISPFSFWIDETMSTKPSSDKIAALFLEPSNEVMNSLIKGNKGKIANEKSKRMMVKNMKKFLR